MQDFRRTAVSMLEAVGISVEFSHHEAGPGQNEIDLRYADALQTADNIMTFRTIVKEVALSQGIYATFMPKPFSRQPAPECTRTSPCSRVIPTRSTRRGRNSGCPRPAATSSRACCATRRSSRPLPTSS